MGTQVGRTVGILEGENVGNVVGVNVGENTGELVGDVVLGRCDGAREGRLVLGA